MTLPLKADWAAANSYTHTAENNVATVVNALGAGTTVIPRRTQTSNAATLTLTTAYCCYVFYGTTATWTLPAISVSAGMELTLYNRGSGTLTVNRAGSDQIYRVGTLINTFQIPAGASATVLCDATYWFLETAAGIVPTYDNSSTIQSGGYGNQAKTWTQTVGSGGPFGIIGVVNNNQWLTVGQTGSNSGANATVSFGGVSCPLIGTTQNFSWILGGWMWMAFYGAPGIPSGTQTVSVRIAGAGTVWTGPAVSATYSGITGAGEVASTGEYQDQYAGTSWWLSQTVARHNADPGRLFVMHAYNSSASGDLYATVRRSEASFACGDIGTSGSEDAPFTAGYSWDYESMLAAVDLYTGT